MKINKYIQIIISFCVVLAQSFYTFAEDEPIDTTEDKSAEAIKEIFKWEYNATHTQRVRADMDTTMDFFYLYEPNGSIADYKVSVAEYASPTFSLQFRPKSGDLWFLQPYENSIITADDMPDYSAQRPYSELFYSQGLNSEQTAKFTHTQNINKYCNVGFDLKFYKTVGEFDNQTIKGQHVAPWISYYGPRFSTTFKYAFNCIKRGENGGIAEDSLLNYEKLLRMKHPNALAEIRYQNIEFSQKWNLSRKPIIDSTAQGMMSYKNSIGYRMNYYSGKRYFSDKYPDTTFYFNTLYDSLKTNDTIVYKLMNTALFVEMQRKIHKTIIAMNFGLGCEFESLYYHDYNYSIPETNGPSEFYEGIFDISFPHNWTISHQHRFDFAGNNKGAYQTDTKISKELTIKESTLNFDFFHTYTQYDPNAAYYLYLTNNYTWYNDFEAEKSNELGGTISSSWGNISADFHYYLLKNYIAFDATGTPQQTNGNGNAFTAKIQKTTRLWHFLLQNGIIFQDVDVANYQYPTWATYNSLAFQGAFFRKLIHFGIGGEVLYYPKYQTPTFDAALGDFIPQNTYEYGGFPIVNAFLTIKYKPIKLYVKYSGLYALLKEQNYPIAGYPQTNGTISFGISWLFYN